MQTLDKIGDALFGPGGGPPSAPPLAITSSVITSPPFLSDPEMSESIPSEIERLDTSEKRLIPAYLRVIKELSKQKPGSIPEPEQIKDEIDRLIAETSVPS